VTSELEPEARCNIAARSPPFSIGNPLSNSTPAPPNAGRLHDVEPIALRIKDAVRVSGLSRSTIYEEIAARRLPAIKAAGRRLILTADLAAYLTSFREAA